MNLTYRIEYFRFQRDRERDRPRSREPRDGYNSYYNDSPANDYQFRDRDREPPPRERPLPRYPARNPPPQHNIPPLLPHLGAGSHPPPLMSLGPPPLDRKDYYDSYNRYFCLISYLIQIHVKISSQHIYTTLMFMFNNFICRIGTLAALCITVSATSGGKNEPWPMDSAKSSAFRHSSRHIVYCR